VSRFVLSLRRSPSKSKNRWIRNGTALIVEGVSVEQLTWVRRLARSGGARAIRESAGLSASEVARELGVSPAAVSRWERGERAPRADLAEEWAALLRRLAA
jgi:predicted transcriptional regulator